MTGALPRLGAATTALALLLAACGPGAGSPGDSAAAGEQVELTVFAAASLRESFTTLGRRFEQQNPGTTVTFSFGPSSGLATQINEGAPTDVFAAASTGTMDQVVGAGNTAAGEGAPQVFAHNTLEIAVPAHNPADIDDLADLADPDVKVALCQEQVPCGVAAGTVLENADLTLTPVTRETDVRAVLTKVELGEVDAGIVYVTDVRAAGDSAVGVPIPAAHNATTDYPIAVTRQSTHPGQALAFIALVRGEEGGQVLSEQGFSPP